MPLVTSQCQRLLVTGLQASAIGRGLTLGSRPLIREAFLMLVRFLFLLRKVRTARCGRNGRYLHLFA